MNNDNDLLLAFYGDDFTGSTDAMEALSSAGVRTALFMKPPSREQLRARFGDLQVVGIAGVSRSMTPAQMEATLPKTFDEIKGLGARLFHYKVCSTFDSAPEVGSIGRAIDIGQQVFASRFVPIVVGAPALKRYCLFGNLFATVGAETFRLDRHPTMKRHPITPMTESDLRLHLSQQTARNIRLMDILHLTGTPEELAARLAALLEEQPELVLFDVLDDARLAEVGRLLWTQSEEGMRFAVGSSGVEYALAAHWHAANMIEGPATFTTPREVERLIVVSGSCSPVTQEQILTAFERGFTGIAVNGVNLIDSERAAEAERESVVGKALEVLETGSSVIIHSALGPDDRRLGETADALRAGGLNAREAAERLGREIGLLLRAVLVKTKLPRVIVAGGDTSGYVTRELGIDALEMIAPAATGAPLCLAHSFGGSLDKLEIALKGGQLGSADYFERVRRGTL